MTIGTKEIIELISSGRKDEKVRVVMQPRDDILGYAIEVVRLINHQQFQYVGWVSLRVVQQNNTPWVADQIRMCNNAFAATAKELPGS